MMSRMNQFADCRSFLHEKKLFVAFAATLLLFLIPGLTSAFFTRTPFSRTLWAFLSACTGAGTVLLFNSLLPIRWRWPRAILTGFVSCLLMLLFFMEASAWAISGKSFSYEFTWHLSINTLHHGMAGYERTTIAVLFYLMASSIIIGFLHRNISSCTNKKLSIPAGVAALVLLLILPTPAGAALRFWFIRPVKQRKIIVTDKDFKRFGIKRDIPDRNDIRAFPGKNLVLVYLESIENSYLDETQFPGLMPNTRALMKEAVVFENIHQSTNAGFTIGGLFASQAGYDLTDLQFSMGFINNGINPAIGNRLCSLPGVMKKAGYFLSFMKSATLNFAGARVIFTEFGYDELWAAEEQPQEIRGRYGFSGAWGGCRDSMLLRIGIEKFRELSKRNQPFLLTLLTVDSHGPDGVIEPRGSRYTHYGEEPSQLLTAIHRTDQALGKFVEQLKRHPAWKNTILFVVSDHLAMNNSTTIDILETNPRRRLLAFALNAGSPRRIAIEGKTFDLAPTLLELAGVRHNNIFPQGESLLGQPNPRRLFGDIELAQPVLEALLQEKSGLSSHKEQDGTVRVITTPYAALDINGILLPIFTLRSGHTVFPTDRECFIVSLSPENQAEKWQRFTHISAARYFLRDTPKALLLCQASALAEKFPKFSKLPPDAFVLILKEDDEFHTVYGPHPEKLVLPLPEEEDSFSIL